MHTIGMIMWFLLFIKKFHFQVFYVAYIILLSLVNYMEQSP
jgi:hypothetical protein